MGHLRIDVREDAEGLYFEISRPDRASTGGYLRKLRPPRNPAAAEEANRVKAILDLGFRGNRGWVDSLREWGMRGFDRCLPEEVGRQLREEPGSSVTWVLCSPEAAVFPWELLHDGENFLALRHAQGRLLQSDGMPARARPKVEGRELLILADLAANLSSAYSEGEHLARFLEDDSPHRYHGGERAFLPALIGEAGRDAVLEELSRAALVHFCGHSRATGMDSTSGWALSRGEFLSLDDIRELGRGHSVPALVFSNSCSSTEGPAGQDALAGIAGAFLSAGTAGFIGTSCPVEDGAAERFAKAFYSRLDGSEPFASRLQRVQLSLPLEDAAWAAYRYYGDPRFRLDSKNRDAFDGHASAADSAPPGPRTGAPGDGREPAEASAPRRMPGPRWRLALALGASALAVLSAALLARAWMESRQAPKQNFIYQEGYPAGR